MTLQQLCIARGLTLEQLADRAGLALTTVLKLDAGTIRAQPIILRRLAPVLGLEADTLRDELSRSAGAGGASTCPPITSPGTSTASSISPSSAIWCGTPMRRSGGRASTRWCSSGCSSSASSRGYAASGS